VAVLIWIVPFFGGLLAAIAIPQYQDYVVRGKANDAVMAASALKSEIQQAYAQKQPLQTRSIHVFSPSVESVEVNSNGDIVVTLVPQVAGGGRIVITPSIDSEGAIGSWKCSSEGVLPKYLPASCRQ
jgi:type IV pilus assembly protein PilA